MKFRFVTQRGRELKKGRVLNVLGINFSLDSGAALAREGRIVAAAAQERFDRVKHSAAFPVDAIAYCLRHAGLRVDDLDAVAVSWNAGPHLARPNRLRDAAYRDHREYMDIIPARLLQLKNDFLPGPRTRIFVSGRNGGLDVRYYDHHLSHAASAFYASGFHDAAFLTADGYGETVSTLWGEGGASGLQSRGDVAFPHSLGSVYAAVTQYLGFRANNGEGKVMALAGMGDPERFRDAFANILRETEDGFEVDLSYFAYYHASKTRYAERFVRAFGPPREPDTELLPRHLNLAASLQEAVERILLHLASKIRVETGQRRLCLAGGVALNAVAMGVLEREAGFEEIFVFPAAHDAGAPAGAALLLGVDEGARPRTAPWDDRLGPGAEAGATSAALKNYGLRFEEPADAAEAAASRILAGKVVGWMNGRMEFGPRALGARSILADPRRADMKDILNAKVKYRESFRPFAPVVLDYRASEFFEDVRPTPFMNKVVMARGDAKERIPAVVHDDGSVRVQTVTVQSDPDLARLIGHFEAAAGVPMVINTSLNKRGQPICCTVEDALGTFFTSGMDALVLGPFLIEK
ncbi:MAG: carbamoyltransferase [Deltaproteobacteria bacterium]|nr:carbamoyltransferase [Deltaproteobacteria bacterium]